MKINSIRIVNWRSIIDVTVFFDDILILIGQNNHGKSNIMSALLYFFGEINIQSLDFNQNKTELWVEIEFVDLNDDEKTTFQKYVTASNSIKVRKTSENISGTIQQKYQGYLQIPKDDWLREENISNYTKREIAESLPLYNLLPEKGRLTKDIFEKAQSEYININVGVVEFEYHLESTSFLGSSNVAKGIFGDLFFIPSIKKATDELSIKGKSIFSQLYSRVINKIAITDPSFIQAKEAIKNLSKTLNKNCDDGTINKSRPTEISELEKTLNDELTSWKTTLDIQITSPNVDDFFNVGANVLVDDGIKTDIERKGNGLQRALIFSLIKAWSKIIKKDKLDEKSAEDKKISRKSSSAAYFLFEEPELFLHPQAQRELFSSLLELTDQECQVILCTHSSSFISLEHTKAICIVKKESLDIGTTVLQCRDDLFSDLEDKNRFNLSYWINPDRSELFFAKKIILLEGQTDKSIIPLLAKKLDIYRYDYTIIDCGSKDNIPQYLLLLNKFRLNHVVVYDLDHQKDKNNDAINLADKSSLKIKSMINNDLGEVIIFNNDIEEEIGLNDKSNKNKPYKAIEYVNSDDFEFKDSLKNKIKRIYS